MKNLIIAISVSLLSGAAALNVYDRPKDESLFVHSVYFWLKDSVTAEQHNEFIVLLRGLEQIKSVEALEIGQPAGTPRDVVDNSYDVALLVYFEDRAGHDKYQTDPIHTAAIDGFEDWIDKIKIYDAICER
jgi:hypothetical protein